MGTYRIEEQNAEASFAAILAHIRRGDEIVLEQPGAMVVPMSAPAPQLSARSLFKRFLSRRPAAPAIDTAIAACPDALPAALPASRPAAVTSKASWLGKRTRQN